MISPKLLELYSTIMHNISSELLLSGSSVRKVIVSNLTFMGPWIVVYFYSKTNQMHNFRVYWISLYMFRTVFPSIIRSSRLYTQNQVYVIQVASKQSTNLYDIYLILCVQSWTPDDGRRDCTKHVEWYSINSKIVHLVVFTIRKKSSWPFEVQWLAYVPPC
jgi:hypothetical protein